MRKFILIAAALILVLGSLATLNAQLDPLGAGLNTRNQADTYTAEEASTTDANRLATFISAMGSMTNAHASPIDDARTAERDAFNNVQRSLLDLTVVGRRFL